MTRGIKCIVMLPWQSRLFFLSSVHKGSLSRTQSSQSLLLPRNRRTTTTTRLWQQEWCFSVWARGIISLMSGNKRRGGRTPIPFEYLWNMSSSRCSIQTLVVRTSLHSPGSYVYCLTILLEENHGRYVEFTASSNRLSIATFHVSWGELHPLLTPVMFTAGNVNEI